MSYDICEYCHVNMAIKTGSDSKFECYNKAMHGTCEGLTPRQVIPEQGRNELCNCSSGKKYKRCCAPKK
jgi:uncharacterized protein YecA (UPF0149 family)